MPGCSTSWSPATRRRSWHRSGSISIDSTPKEKVTTISFAASVARPAFPYVFFVGTIEPRKGLDVLLAAYRELASADADVELWLAGQAGWGVGAIEQLVVEHPYANRIKRLGFVDDDVLPALLRRARAVAYPSRGEGFGLPVLEAMACGSSVVTSAGTVMEEIAGNGARLVPIG